MSQRAGKVDLTIYTQTRMCTVVCACTQLSALPCMLLPSPRASVCGIFLNQKLEKKIRDVTLDASVHVTQTHGRVTRKQQQQWGGGGGGCKVNSLNSHAQ